MERWKAGWRIVGKINIKFRGFRDFKQRIRKKVSYTIFDIGIRIKAWEWIEFVNVRNAVKIH